MKTANSDQSVDIKRYETICSDSHILHYKLSVDNLCSKEPWIFREEFQNKCPPWSSSWLCEMLFVKVADNGQASIPITLRRTDSANDPVTVRIIPIIRDDTSRIVFKALLIERQGIRGGEVLKETLFSTVPFLEQRAYLNRKLFVNFFIHVFHCDRPIKINRSRN
ncbi:unnamed protein product [Larinioides sclopetarius]|uniref:Uncharacterized protein n=1 Tax=Larinioides sclopetarius TaxID=280406 RepID=A0AAV2BEC7_9ARAC